MKAKKPALQGDPALIDRLTRAKGFRQVQTGEEITWKTLGELVGLGQSSMTDLRSAKRKVEIAEAVVFARYLGVSFSWLAAGEGPMYVEAHPPSGAAELPDPVAARGAREPVVIPKAAGEPGRPRLTTPVAGQPKMGRKPKGR